MSKLFLICIVCFCGLVTAIHIPEENEVTQYRERRAVHGKRKDGECRYKRGPWSDCDSSGMQKKTLTLKKGGSSCEQVQFLTRKCKKVCKYEKGQWTDCDGVTNSRARTDTLKSQSDPSCQPTRTMNKKCKKVCKYNKDAEWTACDNTSGRKSKVLTLKKGSHQSCDATKKISKPCQKNKNAKDKSTGGQDDYEEDED